MTKRFGSATKLAAMSLAVAAAVAMPLSASADGWGRGHHGDFHGGYHEGYRGGYGHDHDGGHWEGGRWIAGALVAGAVVGLVSDALRPAPVYYGPPVVYSQPRTVYYEDAPVVRRRVVTREVIYNDPYRTRYYGDGDDEDDGD